MAKRAKVAISLDQRLLERIEKVRKRTGESRSAVVARALALLTNADRRAERIREYVEAYRKHPETLADEEAARKVARRVLAALPWSDTRGVRS